MVALFFVIGFLLYGQNLRHRFLLFDDEMLITGNALIENAMTPSTIVGSFTRYDPELYIPLTFLSYQVDHAIGGMNPWIFHLTNLLLHICNALLVLWAVLLLARKKWIALAVGLLFLVHPIHVEAVSWAAARKDVLFAFFYLGALVAFLLYRKHHATHIYRYSIELFVLSLLSKVMAITFPAVLLLIGLMDGRGREKKMWKDITPFAGLSLIFLIIGLFGKSSMVAKSTLLEKGLLAFKSIWFYTIKLLWPSDLRIFYMQESPVGFHADFLLPILFVLFFIGGIVWLYRQKQTRLIAFGFLFYLVTLVPTFLNTDKGGYIFFASDRYAYIPSIGFFLALCVGVDLLLTHFFPHPRQSQKSLFAGVGILFLCVLGGLTVVQAATWQDGQTTFSRVLKYHPRSTIAHVNIGVTLSGQGQERQAFDEFQTTLQIDPDYMLAWLNLGGSYLKMNRLEEAENAYIRALQLNVASAPGHLGLSRVFQKMGRTKDARDAFQNAYAIDPEYVRGAIGLNDAGFTTLMQAK